MKTKDLLSVLLSAAALAALPVGLAFAGDEEEEDEEIPFEEAKLYLELNDTDGDLGVHSLVDGDAWKLLEIRDPQDRRILWVRTSGSMRRQGLTELFFESAEPSFDELPPEELLARFPEGVYEFEGHTLEGEELESEVVFSHKMPAPPDNVTVSGEATPENCDAPVIPAVSEPVIVEFDAVTETHPEIGSPNSSPDIEIVLYQVIVERLGSDGSISVDLPPDVTSVQVPPEFIALDDSFKLEIIAREAGGNQTAVETCFDVE